MWEILLSNADWDCFRTLILREILKIQNPLLEEHYAFLGSHTFVPISWMCKKQTSVSHSLTESEIISLDTGLRLVGLPALELWDLIVSVFGNISHVSDRTGQPVNGKNKSYNKIDIMQDIDSVPSNVQSASREALLYVFEDNEAVIKMIMKGRSPTMRHVSRTHRVALVWLFDRINLDSKIQIKYIDTKNQLTDILIKGNFTRDEWNHLLTLFNISHFSSIACIAAMAKRAQQESGGGRVTAKSRPMMNLTARTPSFVSSSASSNPGRTSHCFQDPERHVLDDRTVQLVETSRSDYLQEDYGRSWSSQECKSGAAERDRSVKPEAHFENFVMGSDATEFVNLVRDQVRIRQKKNVKHCRELCRTFNNMEKVYGYMSEIKCIIHAVVNSLCGLRSYLSCGTCTAFVCCTEHVAHSSNYG